AVNPVIMGRPVKTNHRDTEDTEKTKRKRKSAIGLGYSFFSPLCCLLGVLCVSVVNLHSLRRYFVSEVPHERKSPVPPNLRAWPVQPRGDARQHSQFANRQLALRRAAGVRRRNPFGNQHRSASRPAPRPIDQGAEPGPGLRALQPVGPQELLDALQLAHLLV